MSSKLLVFIIRAALGFAGGLALTYFFFTKKGEPLSWFLVAVLAVMVVAAAYLSEAWRVKGPRK
ncbi:MAG: hypothetical protein ACOZHQ_02770 [Thermodesulfobacteriota bacterium]